MTSTEVITSLQKEESEVETSETSQNQEDPTFGTSTKDSSSPSLSSNHMPAIDPDDFMRMTFLLNKEGVQRLRDHIVKALADFKVI